MNGFINCNKPSKMTSSDVVCRIKRLCKGNKIGHMGTLDPGAAGVLPIAIGKATRLFDFLTHKKKIYRARFTYGKTTDTLDSYGKLLQTSDIIPNKEQLENILGEFIGNIMQMPPLYSALKVNGAKAYDLARKNIDFELKARNVEVFNFTLNKQIAIDTFEFDIECGGGTYIRSLVRDTAEQLGTVGYMSSLIRLKSGVFDIIESKTIDEIEQDFEGALLPMDFALNGLRKVYIPNELSKAALNGMYVPLEAENGENVLIYVDGELLGIAQSDKGRMELKCYLRV